MPINQMHPRRHTTQKRLKGAREEEACRNLSGLLVTIYPAAQSSRVYVSNRDPEPAPPNCCNQEGAIYVHYRQCLLSA